MQVNKSGYQQGQLDLQNFETPQFGNEQDLLKIP